MQQLTNYKKELIKWNKINNKNQIKSEMNGK